jgi:hypothetical protein
MNNLLKTMDATIEKNEKSRDSPAFVFEGGETHSELLTGENLRILT